MEHSPRILVVDDDPDLCRLITEYLSQHDFDISSCHSGSDAIERILQEQPTLVILDLMLPGVDGLGVCREVRSDYNGLILMLTALDDQADEIAGLEIGADDYLTKPVSPRLLLARIRTLLRRHGESTETTTAVDSPLIVLGHLEIDQANREVRLADQVVPLTTTEFDFLWLLASHSGKPLSRETLHQNMYRLDLEPSDRRVDLLVSRLRKKLGDDTAQPHYIKTVRGRGYQMGTG